MTSNEVDEAGRTPPGSVGSSQVEGNASDIRPQWAEGLLTEMTAIIDAALKATRTDLGGRMDGLQTRMDGLQTRMAALETNGDRLKELVASQEVLSRQVEDLGFDSGRRRSAARAAEFGGVSPYREDSSAPAGRGFKEDRRDFAPPSLMAQ